MYMVEDIQLRYTFKSIGTSGIVHNTICVVDRQ